MKIYIVIQIVYPEAISGFNIYKTEGEANSNFDKVVEDESLEEIDKSSWSKHEVEGTLRIAGWDGFSIQIIEREI